MVDNDLQVRPATATDAAACAAIYRRYVLDSVITFETEPPTVDEMAIRIASASAAHAWLVLESAGEVVGYAYAGPYRSRAAYRWSCEVSVYLESGRRRSGGGRLLYSALLARLTERGYRMAVACLTTPSESSEVFHRSMGFEWIGRQDNIGWKHGRWHAVAWMQLPLADPALPPGELT